MQVRVYNDNIHPYSEQFRDQLINIPAKGFIMMDAGDAQLFRGTFAPIKVNADNQPIPEGYKMIRIEEGAASTPIIEESKHICQACRYEASSPKDLLEHSNANHKDAMVVDEEAERAMRTRGKKKAS